MILSLHDTYIYKYEYRIEGKWNKGPGRRKKRIGEDRRMRNRRAGEEGQEIMPGRDGQEGRKRGHKKRTEGGSKEEGTRGR